VRKERFAVPQPAEDVPAIMWMPGREQRRRPLVLLGHGGGLHKETRYIDRLGNWLAGEHGIACLAIDLPFHGERITAAVLGLFGVPAADTGSAFARAARQVTIPVLFLQQLDDRLFPSEDGQTLFGLLGSADKTLHANPGGHLGLPRAEFGHTVRFLRHHLGAGGDPDSGAARPRRPRY